MNHRNTGGAESGTADENNGMASKIVDNIFSPGSDGRLQLNVGR